jgi:hypothetical protein
MTGASETHNADYFAETAFGMPVIMCPADTAVSGKWTWISAFAVWHTSESSPMFGVTPDDCYQRESSRSSWARAWPSRWFGQA